jgi:putative endonuclease
MLFNLGNTKAPHLLRGEQAEQQALAHLQQHGLQLVCRNFRCRYGELDLVMTDRDTLVIAEVRFRKNARYGSALESVTTAKQSRIIAATHVYLATHKSNCPLRFDVVALSGDGQLDWIKNAF